MRRRDLRTDDEGVPIVVGRVRPRDVMTVDEAARFLRVGVNQLYDAIGRGDVPHVRIGKTIRLGRRALILWLQAMSENRTKER